MNALLVTIRLVDPALLTGVGNGEENSSRSLPYIPGAALRGAIVGRYRSAFSELRDDETAVRLFFNGRVRFLNAYPAYDKNGARALPLPATWRKKKEDDLYKAEIEDAALHEAPDPDKTEPVSKRFCSPQTDEDDHKFVVFNPQEELAIHIASQGRGEVRQGLSTVFQYQSLGRGQRFTAVIVGDDKTDLKKIQALLMADEHLFLGRSRAAGYGRAVIEKTKIEENWQEAEGLDNGLTTITLLSDMLLRDENGQPTHDLDGYLSRQLKKEIKHRQAYVQPTVVGGFNRKWGLPLPQFPALGMGSVFVYEAADLTAAELAPLAASGIGERRVDGFGRLAVNWPGKESFTVEKPASSNAPASFNLSAESKALAQTMANRLLRQMLDSRLVTQKQQYNLRGTITNHQLSRLRGVLRDAINQQQSSPEPVKTFLDKLKPTAQTQLERVRVVRTSQESGPRLRNWVDKRLADVDGLVELGFNTSMRPTVAGQTAELTKVIEREYTLRLIEALIDGKMKQNGKEGN